MQRAPDPHPRGHLKLCMSPSPTCQLLLGACSFPGMVPSAARLRNPTALFPHGHQGLCFCLLPSSCPPPVLLFPSPLPLPRPRPLPHSHPGAALWTDFLVSYLSQSHLPKGPSKSDLNTLLRPSRSFLPSLQHSTSPSWPERSCSSLLAFAPCRGDVGGPASSPTSVFGILLFL